MRPRINHQGSSALHERLHVQCSCGLNALQNSLSHFVAQQVAFEMADVSMTDPEYACMSGAPVVSMLSTIACLI